VAKARRRVINSNRQLKQTAIDGLEYQIGKKMHLVLFTR